MILRKIRHMMITTNWNRALTPKTGRFSRVYKPKEKGFNAAFNRSYVQHIVVVLLKCMGFHKSLCMVRCGMYHEIARTQLAAASAADAVYDACGQHYFTLQLCFVHSWRYNDARRSLCPTYCPANRSEDIRLRYRFHCYWSMARGWLRVYKTRPGEFHLLKWYMSIYGFCIARKCTAFSNYKCRKRTDFTVFYAARVRKSLALKTLVSAAD